MCHSGSPVQASDYHLPSGGVATDGRVTCGVCLGETLVKVPWTQNEQREPGA